MNDSTAGMLFRTIFEGWSDVRSWRELSCGDHIVQLRISEPDLVAMTRPGGARELVDRLAPRKVTLPRQLGVRFHGRIVGKRAQ